METQKQNNKRLPTIMQMTLDQKSKIDLIKSFNSLTPDLIVQNKYPSISALARKYSVDKVETVTAIMLHDLSSSFNGELTEDEVNELNAELHSSIHLKNLSLEDVYYCFRQLKTKQHNRKLSVSSVLNAMNQQFEKRTQTAAKINYNAHLSHKHIGDRSENDELEKHRKALADSLRPNYKEQTITNTK